MAETIKSDEIVGRYGLKIPRVEEARGREGYKAVSFFHRLWEVNGFDVSTEPIYNGTRRVSKSFSHELVIPPSYGKPLTVLKAIYAVRDKREVERELERNKATSYSWRNDAAVGATENYTVAIPPTELGSFELVTSVRYDHYQGGRYSEDDAIDVTHTGKHLIHENWVDLESLAAAMHEQPDPRDLCDQRFEAAVTRVLQQTVELLSC